ncbi:Proteasomal ATPase-associated factor 1 like protein [Argiope bruennichi]|uniref:Proteasomal ATPase-associated factor 1 like protein n=1 Tax=Argiope bruennichi TaxID=94029 RepID=A0A8T0ERS2_ARGBR|nr:Proteasomal ATPase-associated factor 1 like protein [Argiope bruennichi]
MDVDSVTPTIVKRPLLSIQCDWDEALREKDGTAWISCKEYGKNSIHGKLTSVKSSENELHTIEASDRFKVENVTPVSLCLSHEDPNCRCEFFAPNKIFTNSSEKCCKFRSTGTVLRNLEGHIWDVYHCSFFPSGMVVLSAGADMQIKIWAADTGQAVTDAAVVDRGKNIVSVSKDGSARLWDCGSGSCLHVLSKENGNINCCAISPVDIDVGVPENPPNEKEVGTEGKLLLLGSESGFLKGVGLQSHQQIFKHQCESAVNCCCFISSTSVAFGTQDGKVWLFDLRAR